MRFSHFSVLALGIAISGAYSSPAYANPNPSVTVTVYGQSYTITTIVGTENALSTSLSAQPWFGSIILAGSFAEAVGTQLGLPGTILGSVTATLPAGPAFSDSFDPTYHGVNYVQYAPQIGSAFLGSSSDTAPVTFAEVVPTTTGTNVPEPTSIAEICAGLGAFVLTRRRR